MAITRSPYPPAANDDVPFDLQLAIANTAQDMVSVPAGEVGRSFSIVNEGPGNVYIKADAVATLLNGTRIANGETYSMEGLAIATKISFLGDLGKKPKVHGVLWCGT